jgi:N-methylhydantoinase A
VPSRPQRNSIDWRVRLPYRLGVDIGGTFTDLQLLNEETGELWEGKVPTTPEDLALGFGTGMRSLLDERGVKAQDLRLIVHGTTIVTNALLERTFQRAGLVVTNGYRGLLEYARVHVRGPFGTWLFYEQPPRVVPLERVREAHGRIDRHGNVLVPVDEQEIAEIADWYARQEVRSVGVSLMWSFKNPAHEEKIREIFRDVYPECDVLLSSEILPEIREYERAITTALSAALRPRVSTYLERIETMLVNEGVTAPLMCMKSSGGIVGTRAAEANPMVLALSGPAAGVIGMANVAGALGYPKAITVDMGGTSTDISFIEDAHPLLATGGDINEYPIQLPIIDIHTIGAGGGSIAWIGAGGKARVGPKSAGSNPGPVAYGRGGTQATLTDAMIVLGRIADTLLGGKMQLDAQGAAESVDRFGRDLGLGRVEAALTIVELAIHNMDMAIREVSTKKGRDPRECVLIPFGGAGPGHAGRLAELLQIPTVLFPSGAGVGSTHGLLATDVRVDFVHSVLVSMEDDVAAAIEGTYQRLAKHAWEALAAENVPEAQRVLAPAVDFRYVKEQYTISVEIPPASEWLTPPDATSLTTALKLFHAAHRKLCGFDYSTKGEAECELVNVRIAAIGRLAHPSTPPIATGSEDSSRAARGARSVYFESAGDYVQTPVFWRPDLLAGNVVEGPAVIDEFDSTTLIFPGHVAEVVTDGTIVCAVKSANSLASREHEKQEEVYVGRDA